MGKTKEQVSKEISSLSKMLYRDDIESSTRKEIENRLRDLIVENDYVKTIAEPVIENYLETSSDRCEAIEYAYNYFKNETPNAFDFFASLENSLLGSEDRFLIDYFYDLYKSGFINYLEEIYNTYCD